VKAAWENTFVFVIAGRLQTERWGGVVGKGLWMLEAQSVGNQAYSLGIGSQ